VTRTIGASQSGTLDGGPVTWIPPGASGFVHDSRLRGTRVDFSMKVRKSHDRRATIEVPGDFLQISISRRTAHEGIVPVMVLRRLKEI